jgi:hypothetical protein
MNIGLRVTACVCLPVVFSACSALHMATASKGTDTGRVTPGTSSLAVRGILGNPVREWRNDRAITFRLYQFDGGRAAQPGYAAMAGVLAIGSLGLSELLLSRAVEEDERTGRTRSPVRMIVSYDPDDLVLGTFDEFDHLPEDGRSVRRSGPPAAR